MTCIFFTDNRSPKDVGHSMICSMFFIKFFGVLLAISFVTGAGVLLFYITNLEKEIDKEKGGGTERSGEQ